MSDRIEDGGPSGRKVVCGACSGHGLVQDGNRWDPSPKECSDCGGSGTNWQYPRGAIARYYGGPLIGRASERLTPRSQGLEVGRG